MSLIDFFILDDPRLGLNQPQIDIKATLGFCLFFFFKFLRVCIICIAAVSPDMTWLINGLEHFSSGSFIEWVDSGPLEGSLYDLLLCTTSACWKEQVCRILFWQKENIVGLRPPRDRGPRSCWEEGVCVCVSAKPTAVFCFRGFLSKLPRHGLQAIAPKSGQPEKPIHV